MSYHFDVLCEVAEGALGDAGTGLWPNAFTSREFGEVLHESMYYLPPLDRYPRPLRRGAVAGQVLRVMRQRGLVVRAGQRRGGSWWQSTHPDPATAFGPPAP
jgi:hypothetical protein